MPTVLITGIGRRLGFFLAHQFLDMGYQVIGQYRSERAELTALRNKGVTLIQADFSLREQLIAFTEEISLQCKSLDVLVHNASLFVKDDPKHSCLQQAEFFDAMYAVHMLAPKLINEALHPALLKAKGSVVMMTDIYADQPHSLFRSYCASKAGLANLMKSYAGHWAPEVRVNAIEPGPMLFLDEHDKAHRERVIEQTPLAKEGGLLPIWQTIQLLITNDYLTACSIKVDGGRSMAQW
ncbi:SDR family NAD(P)-dependent oxidoreductase [Agarivorans sp. TSD2052]|uniref:SDR family NAD(P)-dependent oxidoreductase n=1 Tax=Agarivorans sp. TSD2052 TaxID=2937286 RepID=UPI00200BD058|nr:SDR family NAD(P)-dependent oxidoreductase [Agarivorans sp. TSD2052]UPW19862.1 SDR family NAD(P)-dependent oxidoreductase [Agarivorans sp. TSD2052]